MNQLDQIEQKYGSVLPDAYKSMHAAGWLDVKSPASLYFWLLEAEWMPLREIIEYEPDEDEQPGLVPFAFEGDGSYWCWWPAAHPGAIVLCPRDCYEGEFYALSFVSFMYRRLLDYAGCVPRAEEPEARRYLRETTARLADYLPTSWQETLNTLASAELVQWTHGKTQGGGFLTYGQKQEIIRRDVNFPLLGQTFRWMHT